MNIKLSLNSDLKTITVEVTESVIDVHRIYIDTDLTFNCSNGPNDNKKASIPVISTLDEETGLYYFTKVVGLNDVSVNGALIKADINNNMFFVYVPLDTVESEYGFDYIYNEEYLRNTIFDSLYKDITNSVCCNINDYAIHLLLLYNAFNFASSYKDKVHFWQELHRTSTNIDTNCMCNG